MKTSTTNNQKIDGKRNNWLLIDEIPDPLRPNVPVESMQENELKAKLGLHGGELNLWLEWIMAKRDIL